MESLFGLTLIKYIFILKLFLRNWQRQKKTAFSCTKKTSQLKCLLTMQTAQSGMSIKTRTDFMNRFKSGLVEAPLRATTLWAATVVLHTAGCRDEKHVIQTFLCLHLSLHAIVWGESLIHQTSETLKGTRIQAVRHKKMQQQNLDRCKRHYCLTVSRWARIEQGMWADADSSVWFK